ncbi:MAG: hypothetical protein ACR2H4_12595 [Pyrinomonadaceae bacterium]
MAAPSFSDDRRASWPIANNETRTRWLCAVFAGCALILLSLYPQLQLWVARGNLSTQALAYNHGLGDEVAYAAYVNSLIAGRPRLNDPYTGRDGSQAESVFSIQFFPAYAIALTGRVFGLSSTVAFMLLTPVAAFLSALALFWLIVSVTGNNRLAICGVFLVLCLGTLVSGEGTIAMWVGKTVHFDYFPFLRRYQPAASFPLIIVFFALVWRVFSGEAKRLLLLSTITGVVLGLLVFSYFYLWTAAFAWLILLTLIWSIARPNDRAVVLRAAAVMGGVFATALIPYLILLSHRAETTETVQALVLSRAPDISSPAQLVGGLVLLVLILGSLCRRIDYRNRQWIFAASFAALPFVVLNQQLITGRVMQPIHYKGFVTGYSVLIAIVLTMALQWRIRGDQYWAISKRVMLWVALAALDWGMIETHQAAKRSFQANNQAAEEMIVYARLNQQTETGSSKAREVVLFSDLSMADAAPAATPHAVLWAPHMVVYSGSSGVESKERLYRHLYYTGVGVKELEDYFYGRNIYYGVAVGIFGFDRLVDGLNPNVRPISTQEIQNELTQYQQYISTFNETRAAHPLVSYLVTNTADHSNLSNFDKWYERDRCEVVGSFNVCRVGLRDERLVRVSAYADLLNKRNSDGTF